MDAHALRELLPRTWGVLFARHGSPNEVQLQAIPELLKGRDTLICAPTASGKTEAYLAPLVERHVGANPGKGACRVLIVCPTRALVNDLHRRIAPPLDMMGIECGRWTGDHHDQGRLHTVTLLTPEGLDSRISRARASLSELKAVVLDELHVVDDTARGDQLRILLSRLRHGMPLQVVGASATVGEPESMARRYMRDPVIVQAGERRKVLARICIADGPLMILRELERMVERGFRKILCFARSREDVEVHVQALRGKPPFGGDIFAHHGSLARSERLRVEQQFLSRPVALCFATTTLELGIDIGDIDLVAILGAPPDVSRLVQQAGRGGRRASRNPVLALARSAFDAEAFRIMLESASRGDLLPDKAHFRPSVLIQQALSILHENPGHWITPRAIRSRLPEDLAELWTEDRLKEILENASKKGWFEPCGGRWALGERGERQWARVMLHSNLRESKGITVRDSLTGDAVGIVAVADGPGLSLAGSSRQVLRAEGNELVTRHFGGAGLPVFSEGSLARVGARLATHLLHEVGIPVPSRSYIDGVAIFHGLGTTAGLLLGKLFELEEVEVKRAGPLAVIVDKLPAEWPTRDKVRKTFKRYHPQLARSFSLGSFHHDLPVEEQRRAVEDALDLTAIEEFLAEGLPCTIHHSHEEDAAWW